MRKIGITGGVGAGKSTVLGYLKEKYGAKIYMADNIAHILEEPGHDCYNMLISEFGNEILDSDGKIDSKKFAGIIFNNQEALDKVNSIVHPEVKKYVLDKIREEEALGTKYFILEAALLIEDGYACILDELWYVHTDALTRRERLKKSRGYSDKKIDSIFASQLSESEYRKACRYTIDNTFSETETEKSIDLILGDTYE